jgi:hypothetical protein
VSSDGHRRGQLEMRYVGFAYPGANLVSRADARDIARRNIASSIAMILSFAMLLSRLPTTGCPKAGCRHKLAGPTYRHCLNIKKLSKCSS